MTSQKTFAAVMFLWLLSYSGLQASILPGNFLPNPSVEADEDQDGIPDGWLRGGNNPAGDIWDDTEPVTGDNTAKVWDARTGREVHTLSAHHADVLRVAFSPDGRLLATLSLDGTSKVWDVRSFTRDN